MRHRGLAAATIFLLVVLARLPFVTTHLWAWDSVLYARALEQGFHVDADVAGSRPHPPGYLWYVGAAQLARLVLGDSNAALVLVSILASAACAALLWLLATRYVRPLVALTAALAFAASPVVWAYSEVAYPYTVLAAVSLGLGALFLDARRPLLASLIFGIVSGARQDVLVLLAPLWLWSLRPLAPRRLAAATAVVAAGALAWWVPSALLSGGPLAYTQAVLLQGGKVATTYSAPAHGVRALLFNLGLTTEALGWGLGLMAIPLAMAAGAAALRAASRRSLRLGPRATGLLVWAAPALGFYALVHIGEWGYVLSVLPALFLAAAVVADRALGARAIERWAPAGALAVLLPALVFVAGDGAYKAVVGDAEFSAAALARHDASLGARAAWVRRELPTRSTLIVARDDYLLVRYYLPEYRAIYWDPDPYAPIESKRRRVMRPTNVVVFTAGLQPERTSDIRRIVVGPGIDLAYLTLDPGFVLELDGERYVVREPPVR